MLVALNMTSVCQGHDEGGGHRGVHLAILGEMHEPGEMAGDAIAPLSAIETLAAMPAMRDAAQDLPSARTSGLTNVPRLPSGLSISTLGSQDDGSGGLTLTAFFSTAGSTSGGLPGDSTHAYFLQFSSQIDMGPESPPPRNARPTVPNMADIL